ncbi:MAG: hypothetical protein ABWY00_10595 [Dongiaceae bacterium]
MTSDTASFKDMADAIRGWATMAHTLIKIAFARAALRPRDDVFRLILAIPQGNYDRKQ